jgi:hypothetical protein
MRVFKNSVLRRIFGPKKEEVVGGCRRLHNEQLHKLYASQKGNKIKEDEMGGAYSAHGRDEKFMQYSDWKT